MNAMNAIAKRTYALGWLLFLIALIERLLVTKDNVRAFANEHNVMPHNFLEMSFLFFLITVASRACCPPEKA
jgi:hypothetical protein